MAVVLTLRFCAARVVGGVDNRLLFLLKGGIAFGTKEQGAKAQDYPFGRHW